METSSNKTLKILVADDSVDVSGPLVQILGIFCQGASILCAPNGASALQQIRGEGGVDLLISDVDMPEMDGPQLAEKVREEFPNTTVILMSGRPAPDGHKAHTFLLKPLDMGTIKRMVDGARK